MSRRSIIIQAEARNMDQMETAQDQTLRQCGGSD